MTRPNTDEVRQVSPASNCCAWSLVVPTALLGVAAVFLATLDLWTPALWLGGIAAACFLVAMALMWPDRHIKMRPVVDVPQMLERRKERRMHPNRDNRVVPGETQNRQRYHAEVGGQVMGPDADFSRLADKCIDIVARWSRTGRITTASGSSSYLTLEPFNPQLVASIPDEAVYFVVHARDELVLVMTDLHEHPRHLAPIVAWARRFPDPDMIYSSKELLARVNPNAGGSSPVFAGFADGSTVVTGFCTAADGYVIWYEDLLPSG